MKQKRSGASLRDHSRRGSTIKPKSVPPQTTEGIDQTTHTIQSGRTWLEVAGIAPDLLDGQDAQEWVDKLRGGNGRLRRHPSRRSQ